MRHVVEEGAALYVRDRDRYVPTHYAQGPWRPDTQFGGAPNGLLATLVEGTPSPVPMQLARLTTDLMRPVPMRPLTPEVRVVREGKRIQVVAASLLADGVEVVRCSALRLRRTDLGVDDLPDGRGRRDLPRRPRPVDDDPFPGQPPGSRLATEYLFEESGGYYHDPNWIRLRIDVIAGERPTPVARLAYVADTASGSAQRNRVPVRWINADAAINVVREPQGEWLSLDGRGWIGSTGMGQVQATLHDTSGVVATVSMVRLVDPPATTP